MKIIFVLSLLLMLPFLALGSPFFPIQIEVSASAPTTNAFTLTIASSGPVTYVNVASSDNSVQRQCPANGNCLIGGLTPGTVYSFQATATDSDTGETKQVAFSITTLQGFNTLTINGLPTFTGVTVSYGGSGGVPGGTTYSIFVDDTPVPQCTAITATTCTITGFTSPWTHAIRVSAVNDGATQSNAITLSSGTANLVTNPITIVYVHSYSIQFSYSASDPSATFVVLVNGIQDNTCTITNSCSHAGLTADSPFTISVKAVNGQGSANEQTATGKTYPSITGAKINSVTTAPYEFTVTFSSTGGYPGGTTYTLIKNGTAEPSCTDTTNTQCTLNGITALYTYNIQLAATNDGTKSFDTITAVYNAPYVVSHQLLSITTTSIILKVSVLSADSFSYMANGIAIPECNFNDTCTLTGLTPDTTYSIYISATNTFGTSPFYTTTITTYSLVSKPTMTTTQIASAGQIIVNYSADGGVPNQTLFTVRLNDAPVAGCVNVPTTVCTITGLPSVYSSIVKVTATNDGYSNTVSKLVEIVGLSNDTAICPGTPMCSGRGECLQSGCRCEPSWSGPSCNSKVEQIDVSQPSPVTRFSVASTADPQQLVTSKISIVELLELDPLEQVVTKFTFDRWTLLGQTEDDNVTSYNYRVQLDSRYTIVDTKIDFFKKDTNITFADGVVEMVPYTIKFTVNIGQYSFADRLNSLQLVMEANMVSDGDACSSKQIGQEQSKNIQWTKVNIDNRALYGRYLNRALVDNLTQPINSFNLDKDDDSYNSVTSRIGITVPFFEHSVVIDPDFSSLIDIDLDTTSQKCKGKSSKLSTGAIAGIVVGCTVFAALLVGAALFIRSRSYRFGLRIRELFKRKESSTKLNSL